MDIHVDVSEGLAKLTLDDPDNGNRMEQRNVIHLAAVLDGLSRDKTVKAVLLSGAGADFCKGRTPGARSGTPTPLALRDAMMEPILDVYRAFRAIEVPILSLVQGEAQGFGAALGASADLTIAADNARFSFPELMSDMPPTLAMATVMDRVHLKALTWMVYTNAVIGAEEARVAGLVSRVVPLDDLNRAGEETVGILLSRRREALAGVKKFIAAARLQDFAAASDQGATLLAGILCSR
ncbi:MAG: enoyl-CoA hydratase/isomerase family protein [Rhodospirillum sp.]|nr:enoyl-CoA hydratase/isomerase family protein [Rhodospirillum sp.]MCF8489482.1 enoyl-CoA hydratase/isomerase family protein [Rhodospirillum sp.]